MDLIGRKLSLDNGGVVARYINDMRETARNCAGVNDSAYQDMAQQLNNALDALEDTTEWMKAHVKQNPSDALSGATPYLRQFALSAGGHYLIKGALAIREDEAISTAYANRKRATAQFYAANLLPQVAALNDGVKAGFNVLDEIGLDALAS